MISSLSETCYILVHVQMLHYSLVNITLKRKYLCKIKSTY